MTGRTASASSEQDLSPDRFAIHHADTQAAAIAFVHEGEGGLPLLLVHGWPETKRIWWRNISVVAAGRMGRRWLWEMRLGLMPGWLGMRLRAPSAAAPGASSEAPVSREPAEDRVS